MTCNLTDDELKIKLLEHARIKVENGVFLCSAICSAEQIILDELPHDIGATASHEWWRRTDACGSALIEYVGKCLNPHAYYSAWLWSKVPEFKNLRVVDRIQAAQAGRLAWIDHMIAQLKESA